MMQEPRVSINYCMGGVVYRLPLAQEPVIVGRQKNAKYGGGKCAGEAIGYFDAAYKIYVTLHRSQP
eukprot:scaffold277823_cov45-Attheya_sp.AAC.2